MEDAVVLEVGGRAAEDLVLGGVLVLEVADQMTFLALGERKKYIEAMTYIKSGLR